MARIRSTCSPRSRPSRTWVGLTLMMLSPTHHQGQTDHRASVYYSAANPLAIVRLWAASCGIVDNFLALHPLFDAIYAPTGGYGRHQVRQSLGGVMAKTQPHPSDSWSWIPDNAIPYMKFLSIDGCYQFNKSTKLPLRTVYIRSNRPSLNEYRPSDRH